MSERPLATVCFSFTLGIFLTGFPAVSIVLLMLLMETGLLLLKNKKKELPDFFLLLIPLTVCAGLLYGAGADTNAGEKSQLLYNQSAQVTGKIYKREKKNDSTTLYLKNTSIELLSEEAYPEDWKVNNLVIYLNTDETFLIGNTISVKGKLKSWEKPRNEGQFDAVSYYSGQKIDFKLEADTIKVLDNHYSQYREALEFMKSTLSDSFYRIAKEKDAAILTAMILGDKSQLDMDIKEMYQKSGIMHILVISGLHISFIGMICYKMLRKTGLNFMISGSVSVLLIISYGLMTGLGVSTIRALIMFGISMGARIAGKTYDMATSISLSAALILLENPLSLYQAGFLLSFGAMVGIGAAGPVLEMTFPGKIPFCKEIWANMGINLITLPILVWFFYELPVYSLFLNLLIVPLSTILLLSGMIGGVMGLVNTSLGIFIVAPCHYILDLYERLCNFFLNLPGSVYIAGRPGEWKIYIYYLLLLILFLMIKKKPGKKYLCFLPILVIFLLFSNHKEFQVTFLDVGQGDCIFIRTPENTTYMIDGGSTNVSDVGKYRIIPYLKYHGVRNLDYLVVTHMDTDHISGIKEIIETSDEGGIQVEYLVLARIEEKDEIYIEIEQLARAHNLKVLYIKSGDIIKDKEVKIKCLHPGKGFHGDNKNNSSIVLSLSFYNFDMLLTGDIEDLAERYLMETQDFIDYDVLKVAHHGSEYSTSEKFLSIIKPEFSIISCSERNQYGHPHQNLLDRLKAAGSRVFLTKERGGITIKTDGNNIVITQYLSE